MLKDIVDVKVTGDQRLRLKFEHGEGEIDLAAIVAFEGVFASVRDPKLSAAVVLDPELGAIRWPSGADLDPDVLYAMISGELVPDLTRKPARTRAV
jgi:hypothetical protein